MRFIRKLIVRHVQGVFVDSADEESADLQSDLRDHSHVLDGIPTWRQDNMLLLQLMVDSSTSNETVVEIGAMCAAWMKEHHPDKICAFAVSDQRSRRVGHGSYIPEISSEVHWDFSKR